VGLKQKGEFSLELSGKKMVSRKSLMVMEQFLQGSYIMGKSEEDQAQDSQCANQNSYRTLLFIWTITEITNSEYRQFCKNGYVSLGKKPKLAILA